MKDLLLKPPARKHLKGAKSIMKAQVIAYPLEIVLSQVAESAGETFGHRRFRLPRSQESTFSRGPCQGSEIIRQIRRDLMTGNAPIRWGINE